MDVQELLASPESKTLEFKRDLSSPGGILRTIVAFANTAGGVILLGVEDDRTVRGVEDPLDLEERLANILADGIHPRLVPDIEIFPWRTTHLLGVTIHPSSSRPHYLERVGLEQGVFVRVGSTNRRADPAMIAELQRFARGGTYDEQPMPDLPAEAIDFDTASEMFESARPLRRGNLKTLRLLSDHQGREVPTIGGFLLFGKERLERFPDAWVQVARFEGGDRSRILDRAELRGNLIRAIEDAALFVRRNTAQGAVIDEMRRVDRPTFPSVAIREAVVNAVAHADYSQQGGPIRVAIFDDRIEIENPGLLPFGVTVEDLWQGISKLRNRVIGRVFHELGLMEHWGSGIQRMVAACRSAGLDPPALEEIATRFRVTIFAGKRGDVVLDQIDARIVETLERSEEGLSTHEIATTIDRSDRATRTRLRSLVERGLIAELGMGPHDPHRRYHAISGVTTIER